MSVTGKIALQPGYILHHHPYRDSSRLLEVFTRDHGRVGLVARGSRARTGRAGAPLQAFTPLLLTWSSRGELGTLGGAEVAGTVPSLAGTALFAGFYLNELLLRLVSRQDPHPRLYDAYGGALAGLAGGAGERSLRRFELVLLEELGYGLLLECEADSGQAVESGRRYAYHLERGPVPVGTAGSAVLELDGASLLALARGELDDPASLQDARRLLRAALGLYLGDRPLRTREVLARMLRR